MAGCLARASQSPPPADFDATVVGRARVVLAKGGLLQHACNLIEDCHGTEPAPWLLLAAAATLEAEAVREHGQRFLSEGGPPNSLDPRFRHYGACGGVVYPEYERIITGSDRALVLRTLE